MERYMIVFVCLIAATFAGAVGGAVYAKFGPLSTFTVFVIVASVIMALTKPVGVGHD